MHAENLLNKQAARLLSEGRKIDVIYLYKKARQHGKAASALVELAKKAKARSSLLVVTVAVLVQVIAFDAGLFTEIMMPADSTLLCHY